MSVGPTSTTALVLRLPSVDKVIKCHDRNISACSVDEFVETTIGGVVAIEHRGAVRSAAFDVGMEIARCEVMSSGSANLVDSSTAGEHVKPPSQRGPLAGWAMPGPSTRGFLGEANGGVVTMPFRAPTKVADLQEALMAQYVPSVMEWSERALQVRAFVFDFWAEERRGPNLRDVHEGTGLSRRDIVQAYKELQTGIVVVVDQDSPNCDIIKIPPYSAFPSQVALYVDDSFHSFIGCAHEAVAVSKMPHFAGKEVRLESYCACCLEPITFWSREFEVTRYEPIEPLVHVAAQVWDWVHDDMKSMCDHTNFVLDREHGERYERQIGRRGIYFTMDQVHAYVEPAVGTRGWDYHWPSQSMSPEKLIGRLQELGIDLTPWDI